MKKRIHCAWLCLLLVATSCSSPEERSFRTIRGEAQGTTYSVTLPDTLQRSISKAAIDSVLHLIDRSLSAWSDRSLITSFNNTDSLITSDSLFVSLYAKAIQLEALTEGAFQPLIKPLVDHWGFGVEGRAFAQKGEVDSLLYLLQPEIQVSRMDTGKSKPVMKYVKEPNQGLDLNGIAQGFSVDVLAKWIENQGVKNYLVEIGGEVRAKGRNANGEWWRIGIDKPVSLEEERDLQAVLTLQNRAVATSGSYRKFYELNGRKYSHTISPFTGAPVQHSLLSATVLADDCASADALATACMVWGVEESKRFLREHPEMSVEVYLIYDNGSGAYATYSSPGIKALISSPE